MPRHRSKSPLQSVSPNHHSKPSQLLVPPTVKARKDALHDLVGSILVGPPVFPIKQSTAAALFDLALDRLAHHDMTMAEALRRYASQFARVEFFDLKTSTSELSPVGACTAMLVWILDPAEYSADDLRDGFDKYKPAVGKRACHRRTIRRQDELLRIYGRAHNYPAEAYHKRVQRPAWVHMHLPALIAEAQVVSCWHPQLDLTKQDLDEVLNGIDERTSLTELSALVLALLHPLTTDYISKRILPRRGQ